MTVTGLKQVLEAVKDQRNLRKITINDNNLSLTGKNGSDIVELLTQNISLTTLGYEHNYFDTEFDMGVKAELALNSNIV